MVDYVRRHIGLGSSSGKQTRPRWQRLLLAVVALLVIVVLLYKVVAAFSLFLIFLIINILLEQHKLLTSRAPIDIEILSTGVAILSATHSIWWGLLLAICGPIISHATIDYFGDATVMKLLGHVATAIAAALLGPNPAMLFLAVIIGMVVQFCAFVFILGRSAITNVLARLTTTLFAAYLIFIVLPFFN